ncbi:MAG: zinc ribbon domain-containing protein YjdM [Aquabacterium sp.]|nr:zinc ribbon domain-containing protein YjdM [Aquabacterium sp.]
MSNAHAAPACPVCAMENTYTDGENFICPDCAHEWPMATTADDTEEGDAVIKDANGVPLANGDTVVLIKDLKVKGSSITVKQGTKIKGIRLTTGDHEIDCKVDGISLQLKAAFIKKA